MIPLSHKDYNLSFVILFYFWNEMLIWVYIAKYSLERSMFYQSYNIHKMHICFLHKIYKTQGIQ